MKRLEKCCCCATVRTGTLITASLGIILSILTIIGLWVWRNIAFSTFIFDKELDKKLSDMDIPRIIITINLCFTILICVLLIVGVHKRRSWLMLPFVVLGVVLAIGLLISILHTSITYYTATEDHTNLATAILVVGLLYLGIYLYLWAVVFSNYLNVRDDEERGRYRKAPYRR